MKVTAHLVITVECCHNDVVSMTKVFRIVRAGDCHAAPCTIQIIRNDVVSEIFNHLVVGRFHKEPCLTNIANIDVRGWGRT